MSLTYFEIIQPVRSGVKPYFVGDSKESLSALLTNEALTLRVGSARALGDSVRPGRYMLALKRHL